MIETLAKATEIPEKNKAKIEDPGIKFDPDKRIEPREDFSATEGDKRFDPDTRMLQESDINKTAEEIPDRVIGELKDGFYTSFEDRKKCSCLDKSEGGLRATWDGERANSLCRPTYEYMKEKLAKYGVEGINYVNGEADFSPVAVDSVRIDNMTDCRQGKGFNYNQADQKLADKYNEMKKNGKSDWSARDIEKYRSENKLTWHEMCDCKTMQLVPTSIHDYFKHSGGVAECKARDGLGGRFDV